MSAPPRETMPVMRFAASGQELAQEPGVDRHVVDALLRLVLDDVEEHAAA